MRVIKVLAYLFASMAFVLLAQQYTGVSLIGTTLSAYQGSGDVVGPSSSVDSQIVLFNGITGKLIKAFTGSGLLYSASGVPSTLGTSGLVKITSGVPSVVTGTSTNCVLVDGTSTACPGGGGSYTAGTGLILTGSVFSVDPAAVPTFLTNSTSIDFGSITAARCLENTFTLTGALTSDAVTPIWPATLEGGLNGIMLVSAADTIKVRLCNNTASSVDPINQTYGAVLVRSF